MNTSSDEDLLEETIRTYDCTVDFNASTTCAMRTSPLMVRTIAMLSPDPQILDLGCGNGRALPCFQWCGINKYTGIDASEKSIDAARLKYPGVNFLTARAETCGDLFESATFDGFFGLYFFYHLHKKALERTFLGLSRITRPGGVGFLHLLVGERDPFILDFKESFPDAGLKTSSRLTGHYIPEKAFERICLASNFIILNILRIPGEGTCECLVQRM